MGMCVGVFAGVCLDAHAFIPYRAFNDYQQLEMLKWSWAAMNDSNSDGDISGPNEGIEVLVEGGPNGFTDDEQEIVRESFEVWADVPTSYVGFQLVGPTPDPLPVGDVEDFINSVSIQVPTDPNQVVGNGILGLTVFTVLVNDGFYPPSGPVQVYISGGQILEADILIDGATHRPSAPGQKPLASLKSTLVHEIGHFIGLDHTPLNNVEIATIMGTEMLIESPVVALRDASNVLRVVGATPTMFPIQFVTDDGGTDLLDGEDTLAPDDIAGVSFLYPRGSQDAFFMIEQEARTQTRASIPSIPLIGGHIVAWCDVDNNAATARIPLFSTVTGYYEQQPISGGRFHLYGLYKVLETLDGIEPFAATYTFTLNPLNGLDFGRQAPVGYTSADFMGESDWGGQEALPPVFPSEVFHELGNIFDLAKHDLGTPMAFDRDRNAAISVDSSKTLPTMRPWIEPMFGDPDPVCPWNIMFSGITGGGGTAVPQALRGLRDNILLKTALGTAFVDMYYHAAPSAAAFLVRHAGVLAALRFMAPGMEWSLMHLPAILAASLGIVLLWWTARRRRKALLAGCRRDVRVAFEKRRGRRFHTVILALVLGTLPALGSVLNLSDQEMVRMSDEIVTGKVQTVESSWYERNGKRGITTDIGILLDDNIKGGLNKSSMLYLSVLGGRIGNILTVATETPSFSVGQDVLLYLKQKEGGGYVVIAGARGKFEIETDATTSKQYLVGSSELAKTALASTAAKSGNADKKDLRNLEVVKIPLDDYKAYLRGIVKAQK